MVVRTVHDVPGDGDCLFSAVALAQRLDTADGLPPAAAQLRAEAAALREAAVDLLCPRGKPDTSRLFGGLPVSVLVEPLGGEGGAGYCSRMRRRGEWGTTAEILALTAVLDRPIRVYTEFGPELYGIDGRDETRALAIDFRASHYRAVVEREQ